MPKPPKLNDDAKWIGDRRRPTKGESPCPYLRRTYHLPGPVRRAKLQWTALGVADLFLNGRKVGEDFLMPGWSDFRKRAQVMSADVTKMLCSGHNTLGAILGDDWYAGTLLRKNASAIARTAGSRTTRRAQGERRHRTRMADALRAGVAF
jgi:hypothetical protein